jgi:NAD kinase
MMRQQPRIVVVTRETRLAGLLQRWGTRGQAKFVHQRARAAAKLQAGQIDAAVAAMEGDDEEFDLLEDEDETYQGSLQRLTRDLDLGIPVQVIDRRYLPTFDPAMCSVVVVVGQDGLVANTAKYVGDVPIVGVNPDPASFDGVLLPFRVDGARMAVQRVLKGSASIREVTMAEAVLHDGQRLLAFNDLFIGAKTHVSARYELHWQGKSEPQSSSGILVSTGAGSTGWMSSVFNMARGVTGWLGDKPASKPVKLDWSDRSLLWAVREPFASKTSGVDLVAGRIDGPQDLTIESRMSSGGVIFSDGIEADFLEFNGGATARIGVASQQARLVTP